jgi:hypothetical protein
MYVGAKLRNNSCRVATAARCRNINIFLVCNKRHDMAHLEKAFASITQGTRLVISNNTCTFPFDLMCAADTPPYIIKKRCQSVSLYKYSLSLSIFSCNCCPSARVLVHCSGLGVQKREQPNASCSVCVCICIHICACAAACVRLYTCVCVCMCASSMLLTCMFGQQ